MSAYQDAGWLRRLWSLATPGPPVTPHVTNVAVVQDGSFRSSRERAPAGSIAVVVPAPAAGEHAYIELAVVDPLSPPLNVLHRLEWVGLTVAGRLFWGQPGSLTTVSRTAVTSSAAFCSDTDPELSVAAFTGSIATANIPAGAVELPITVDNTAATPRIRHTLEPTALGFWAARRDGDSLYMIASSAALPISMTAVWQAVRA